MRLINRFIALMGRYFWTNCEDCGRGFGGHQWKSDYQTRPTSETSGICVYCLSCAHRRFLADKRTEHSQWGDFKHWLKTRSYVAPVLVYIDAAALTSILTGLWAPLFAVLVSPVCAGVFLWRAEEYYWYCSQFRMRVAVLAAVAIVVSGACFAFVLAGVASAVLLVVLSAGCSCLAFLNGRGHWHRSILPRFIRTQLPRVHHSR